MQHSFNVRLAELYGVEESIILSHLSYWVHLNKANDRNFHEGRYWTYNSAKAFAEIFPYWSAKKIWRLLESLENNGLIVSGHFGDKAMDRTKWYSVREDIFDQCIFQKRKMEVPEAENPVRVDSSILRDSSTKELPNENTDNNSTNFQNDLFGNQSTSSEPPTTEARPPTAEEIYDQYPRKAAKPHAIRAIKKAMKSTPAQTLFEAVVMLGMVWQNASPEEIKFIPYPATWFNQERYKDDPSTWRNEKKASNGFAPGYILNTGKEPALPTYREEF